MKTGTVSPNCAITSPVVMPGSNTAMLVTLDHLLHLLVAQSAVPTANCAARVERVVSLGVLGIRDSNVLATLDSIQPPVLDVELTLLEGAILVVLGRVVSLTQADLDFPACRQATISPGVDGVGPTFG